jgi:hypothetical protein
MFSTVVAIIKAIPIIDKWFKQLATFYVASQINELHEADKEAIRKAIYEQDQRDIEKQIGSTRVGKPSGVDGVERRDTLPGVVQNSEKSGDRRDDMAQ